MPSRAIAHLDLDCFFVSVERVLDPSLVGLPVLVGGDPGARGVVAACSYEARRFGVHSAMPMARALALCPAAVIRRSRHGMYTRASRAVFDFLRGSVPVVQRASVDEGYLDLTGTEGLRGDPADQVAWLRAEIRRRFRLPSSAGLASSRLVAKVASDAAKPDGQIEVPPGEEATFLAPRAVGDLPGIGPRTRTRLAAQGVRTVGQLATLSGEALGRLFGEHAESVRRRARGEDSTPVRAGHGPPRSISHETTFARDVGDLDRLEAVVDRLSQKVGQRLRRAGLRARTVTLKLRDARYRTVTRSRSLPEPADLDREISRTARVLLGEAAPGRLPARLVGVAAQNLGGEGAQPGLFGEGERRRLERLSLGVDEVRARFGFDAVGTGPSLLDPGRRRARRGDSGPEDGE